MSVEKWSDSIVLVHLADDPQFTDELEDLEKFASDHGYRPSVVLDCAALFSINSSNLARLLKLRKQTIVADQRLILCGVRAHVTNTLLVTGLDNIFEISQNVSTGLATLQMARK